MSRALRGLAIALLSLNCCLGWGTCDGCGAAPQGILATLTETRGPLVQRDHAAQQLRWQAAAQGDTFKLGDGIRTSPSSQATLRLVDNSQLQLQPSTLIRFLSESPRQEDQKLDVQTGSAVLTTGTTALNLHTQVGQAVIQAGSRVVLSRAAQLTRYRVEVGSARFRSSGDDTEVQVGEGEVYEVGIGRAVFRPAAREPSPADAGPAAPPAAQDEPDGPELSAAQTRALGEPSVERPSVRLAGEASATIHASSGPVVIGIDVGERCPQGAVVKLGRSRFHGKGNVGVRVPIGRHRYAVHCIEDGRVRRRVAFRGRARVLRDMGTRRLPRRPPTSRIAADGRDYKVFYQNQPPIIVVHWPKAPKSDGYVLNVDGKTQNVGTPEHTFASGALSDGTHKVFFAAANRQSRPAKIIVRFDNAAATASLSAPTDGSFGAGETVTVSGVALPGWKVSADNGTIRMDQEHRYSGQVSTGPEHPDIALRLSHPRLGTHYYLRRSAPP